MRMFKVRVVGTAPDGKSSFTTIKGPLQARDASEAKELAISEVTRGLPHPHRHYRLSATVEVVNR